MLLIIISLRLQGGNEWKKADDYSSKTKVTRAAREGDYGFTVELQCKQLKDTRLACTIVCYMVQGVD